MQLPVWKCYPALSKYCLGRILFAFAVLLCQEGMAVAAPNDLEARISRAQEFSSGKLSAKVLNAGLRFHWIGDGRRFWYKKALSSGHHGYFIVDAATGRQEDLF